MSGDVPANAELQMGVGSPLTPAAKFIERAIVAPEIVPETVPILFR
jgi:hypothetical protein